MRHLQLDQWSQGDSILHRCDARAKLVCLFVFLISLTTCPLAAYGLYAWHAVLMLLGILLSRLPFAPVLLRATVVLPFTFSFALINWLIGETARAEALIIKTYLSTLAIILVAGSTPLPQLMGGLVRLGVPHFLVSVIQFIYRYLFVMSEQSRQIRWAVEGRGGWRRRNGSVFRTAGAVLAVLFNQSVVRAQSIYHAMLARGYQGALPMMQAPRWRMRDGVLVVVVSAAVAGVRWAW